MDFIDVDSYKWREYAAKQRSVTRFVYGYEARRLRDYERRITEAFDGTLVVSAAERNVLGQFADVDRCVAMPNGVDLEYFHPLGPAADDARHTIAFTGVMDYWPNVDGVRWFVDEIFPRVRADVPDARLLVVGSRPTPEVRAWAGGPGVTVTGFVDDVRRFVGDAAVCIAPLRVARGIQNKVLEAMAMGRPVVCTPEALEGIEAANERDVLVASDTAAFAQAVVRSLLEPETARRIGAAGRGLVESRYSWPQSLAALDRLIGREGGTHEPRAG
jgi:sugar transferase (PEP-CTERM/EpsH1 system associated)